MVTRILLTGMSGSGKSTILAGLAARGRRVVDTDYGGWIIDDRWDEPRMRTLLTDGEDVVIAGTVENQGAFAELLDHIVLITAPVDVLLHRLRTRTNNPYGKTEAQQRETAEYVTTVEPLLRRSASLVLDGTRPVDSLVSEVDALLAR